MFSPPRLRQTRTTSYLVTPHFPRTLPHRSRSRRERASSTRWRAATLQSLSLNDRPQSLPWQHRRHPRIWLCGPRRRRERVHPIPLERLMLFISSRLAFRAEPRLTRVAPRSDRDGPDRMPTRRARRPHTAHDRRRCFPMTPSSSLAERSVLRENLVGLCLSFRSRLLLVQRTLRGLALEYELIPGVEW